ncbi:uncharacterized protein LOC142597650 [Dermatophagoides farinae]|uniref:uncharacterized protein LOC142597650 n=1 Tax=Dermatophagoides farinae TaxID=6954 RepID=UPI003F6378ED
MNISRDYDGSYFLMSRPIQTWLNGKELFGCIWCNHFSFYPNHMILHIIMDCMKKLTNITNDNGHKNRHNSRINETPKQSIDYHHCHPIDHQPDTSRKHEIRSFDIMSLLNQKDRKSSIEDHDHDDDYNNNQDVDIEIDVETLDDDNNNNNNNDDSGSMIAAYKIPTMMMMNNNMNGQKRSKRSSSIPTRPPLSSSSIVSNQYQTPSSVDELLFSGYKSELLCELKRILPKQVPSCYFSLMSNQNDTWSGPYVQYTGHDQIDRLTTIISFNGSSKLNYWRTDKCNQINGTQNGELFPPAGQFGQRKIYQFFRPDFCRTFNLTLNETNIQSDVGSLRTDRFHIDRHSFMNSIDYPPNSCYQSKLSSIKMAATTTTTTTNASTAATAMDNDEKQRWKRTIDQLLKTFKLDSKEINHLLHNQNSTESIDDNKATMIMKQPVIKPSGVFDISACQQGAPIFISLPHFLDASDYYRKQLNGLHPNRTKHESYIDIEPQTGTPVDFIARIQVNVDLQTAGTSQPKMASLIMPTMWQSLTIHITQEIANTIEQQTKQPRIIAYTVAALILIIGSIMLIYSIFVCVLYYWHRHHLDDDYNEFINDDNDQTSDPLITNNNNNNEQRQQQPQSNEIMTSTDHDDDTTATNSNYGTVS